MSSIIVSTTSICNNRDVPSWRSQGALRLDRVLRLAHLTNVKVAQHLSADPSLVSRFRSGERVPDADHLATMLELAGASADAVLGLVPLEVVERVTREAEKMEAVAKSLDVVAKGLRESVLAHRERARVR